MTQPSAYKCVMNNITVNGRTLDYYYDIVDKKSAEYRRLKSKNI
jgi:hypothetical protein